MAEQLLAALEAPFPPVCTAARPHAGLRSRAVIPYTGYSAPRFGASVYFLDTPAKDHTVIKDQLADLVAEAARLAQEHQALPAVALPPSTVERPQKAGHGDYR